jgi:hypothetical protein
LLILLIGVVIVIIDGQLIYRGAPGYLAEVYKEPRQAHQVAGMVTVLFHLIMLGLITLVTSIGLPSDAGIRSALGRVGVMLVLTALGHGVTMAVLSRLRQQQLATQIAEAQVNDPDRTAEPLGGPGQQRGGQQRGGQQRGAQPAVRTHPHGPARGAI